jgi:hypothetical protein
MIYGRKKILDSENKPGLAWIDVVCKISTSSLISYGGSMQGIPHGQKQANPSF